MTLKKKGEYTVVYSMPFFAWLGGAVHVANQPGMGFWDGIVWLYYLGRYLAVHFTLLS